MEITDKQLNNFIDIISIDRLNSYRNFDADSTELLLKRYIFNIQISEALYPILSALEIALRNNIHNAVAKLKGRYWLSDEIKKEAKCFIK